MKEKGFSYSFSLEYVRKKRLIVKPNYGFQNELTQLERQLKKRGVLSSNSTIANEDGGSRIHNKNSYRRNIYNSLNNRSENAVSGNLNLNLNANLNLKITNFSRGGSLNKRKTIGSDHLFYPGLKLNNKLLQVKR